MIAHRNGTPVKIPTAEELLDMRKEALPVMPNLPGKPGHPSFKVITVAAPMDVLYRAFAAGIVDQLKDQITTLIEKLPKPVGLESPPEMDGLKIIWTEQEAQAVYDAVREIMLNFKLPDEPAFYEEKATRAMMLTITRSVAVALLPQHRWVPLKHIFELPPSWITQFVNLCPAPRDRLPKLAPSAPPESIPTSEPVSPVTHLSPPAEEDSGMHATRPERSPIHWNSHELDQFHLILAHKLRKRGLGEIPDTNNRGGCNILTEEVRNALLEMPAERRRKLTGLMLQIHKEDHPMHRGLKDLMRKPRLPDLPITQLPAASRNGHSPAIGPAELKPENVQEPVPATLSAPAPETGGLVAQAVQVFGRVMQLLGEVEGMRKGVEEVKEYNNLLMDENATIRERLESAEKELVQLRKDYLEMKEAKRETLPRVAIIGCQRREFEEILKECGRRGLHARFRHYDQDQQAVELHEDFALLMKWISHDWTNKAIKAIPRGNYAFTDGGTAKAVKQLEVWLVTEPAHASA